MTDAALRVLLIKTSSMGDIIHTLPALTDAANAFTHLHIDWVIEDTFSDIARWHPSVNAVIPIALRRWRKGLLSAKTRMEWHALRRHFAEHDYDVILDAQGLVKSAFLTRLARGCRVGLDWRSAREPLASLFYQRQCRVNFYQHAVTRMRLLFSQALGYPLPTTAPDFSLTRENYPAATTEAPYIVLLHGTTWVSKQWPEAYWLSLIGLLVQAGYRIKLSGGDDAEMQRALRLGAVSSAVDVLPRLNIAQMAAVLAHAHGAVAVDTGFGHLAAALRIPTVSLYGPTNPAYTGALGVKSRHLASNFDCAPCLARKCHYRQETVVQPACFATITPTQVWQTLSAMLC